MAEQVTDPNNWTENQLHNGGSVSPQSLLIIFRFWPVESLFMMSRAWPCMWDGTHSHLGMREVKGIL